MKLSKKIFALVASALVCFSSVNIFATESMEITGKDSVSTYTLYDYVGDAKDITIPAGGTYTFPGPYEGGFRTLNGGGETYYSALDVYGYTNSSDVNLYVKAEEINGDISTGYIKSDGDSAYISGLKPGIYTITITNKGDTSIHLSKLKVVTDEDSLKNVR